MENIERKQNWEIRYIPNISNLGILGIVYTHIHARGGLPKLSAIVL